MSSGLKNEARLEHTPGPHGGLVKGTAMNVLMPTTVVGSLPQPDWLVRKDVMLTSAPPRVRLKTIWRVEEPYLEEAQDDATAQAVRMQEAAGIDIITDGEIRRESYFNRFANALGGIDIDNPGEVEGRHGTRQIVPRVVGARCRSPAGADQQTDQDHGARPVHHDAARQG